MLPVELFCEQVRLTNREREPTTEKYLPLDGV